MMVRHGVTGALHRMGKAEGGPAKWTTRGVVGDGRNAASLEPSRTGRRRRSARSALADTARSALADMGTKPRLPPRRSGLRLGPK